VLSFWFQLYFGSFGCSAPDRLRIPRKNVDTNSKLDVMWGSAVVKTLIWGDDPDRDLIEPLPEYGDGAVLSLLLIDNLAVLLNPSESYMRDINYWYLLWSSSSCLLSFGPVRAYKAARGDLV